MLTQKMNERLTRVGPGTPMGELMRRYWHPIAGSAQISILPRSGKDPTKEGQPGGPFKDIEVGRSDVEAVLSGEGAQLPEWR